LPVQAPADASALLRDALFDVCEQSFFAFVEPCSPERFAELAAQVEPLTADRRAKPSEWLKASVAFTGPFGGAIEVVLPERLARSLVGSLLGEPPEAPMPEHQIFDGIGEFANMVCGAWLSRLSDDCLFELRVPAVTRMTAGWSPVAETNAHQELICRMVTINELPMRILIRAN
jgi:CheY-specific phosphatase CheX